MIHIIAAVDRRRALGFENRLLFHLPADLRRFKELTTGHTIIMGRKTFESLPKGALPRRRNIVISRSRHECAGAEVYPTLEEALLACTGRCKDADCEVFIIGGASVYAQAMSIADILHLTEIDAAAPQADVFFPAVDPVQWQQRSREIHLADDRHAVPFVFADYIRRGSL